MTSSRPIRRQARRPPYQAALEILARRDCSVREMERRLARAGFSEQQIAATLERLDNEHLLDDAALALRYARSRGERGLGRRRIRQGLFQRGVGRRETDAAVQGVVSDDAERATIDRLAEACWRRYAGVEGPRRLARVFAFLLRRGFPPGLVLERLRARHPRLAGTLDDTFDVAVEG